MRKLSIILSITLTAATIAVLSLFLAPGSRKAFTQLFSVAAISYDSTSNPLSSEAAEVPLPIPLPTPPPPVHITTPQTVRAIYMTAYVAGTKSWREDLIAFIENSDLNALVIDVKDYTGRFTFKTDDPELYTNWAAEKRVVDIKELIDELHRNNIYVIARISTFQDHLYAQSHPSIAIQRPDGTVWRDGKGISWLDPGSQKAWEYAVKIGRVAADAGFDELNYDYIRFPSDGNLSQMVFPSGADMKDKSAVIESFAAYLDSELQSTGVPISADLFGYVTERTDDLGIGQILEKIAQHVDYVCPMTYPSHYPPGYLGFENPAVYPYEVLYYSITKGVERLRMAGISPEKMRPWIQDFDMGASYTVEMIRQQQKGVQDAGVHSWMVWDPKNKYTRAAYK